MHHSDHSNHSTLVLFSIIVLARSVNRCVALSFAAAQQDCRHADHGKKSSATQFYHWHCTQWPSKTNYLSELHAVWWYWLHTWLIISWCISASVGHWCMHISELMNNIKGTTQTTDNSNAKLTGMKSYCDESAIGFDISPALIILSWQAAIWYW